MWYANFPEPSERAMLERALALAAIAIEAATTPDTRERLLSRRGRGRGQP